MFSVLGFIFVWGFCPVGGRRPCCWASRGRADALAQALLDAPALEQNPKSGTEQQATPLYVFGVGYYLRVWVLHGRWATPRGAG